MNARKLTKAASGMLGVALGAYGSYVGITWYRYGRPQRTPDQPDALLDR